MTDRQPRDPDMFLYDMLPTALYRGRKLHEWHGVSSALWALIAELAELAEEIEIDPDSRNVQEEALDVAVIAARIMEQA